MLVSRLLKKAMHAAYATYVDIYYAAHAVIYIMAIMINGRMANIVMTRNQCRP